MGKPRLILLIRHAQSEGNKNREIHQLIPDHRVKLTDLGWTQAEDAGRRLRALLRPDDTLQFFTSPYRRTRETTEGILRTLTEPGEDGATARFNRHSIKVYEEPRIREQDFGNFQPCSAEMSRMWQERADYGHFFYRIPNGESAADAYDRIAGFNESLWRQFSEPDFPSVCVLVTHGLMTRVFLMKWYHWSVEYFEDLRNINHCEFIVMDQDAQTGKYILETKLRTWSELQEEQSQAAIDDRYTEQQQQNSLRRNTLSQFLPKQPQVEASPQPTAWGGCIDGCNHDHPSPRLGNEDATTLALPSPAHESSQGRAARPTDINDPSLPNLTAIERETNLQDQPNNDSIAGGSSPKSMQPGRASRPDQQAPESTFSPGVSEAGDYFEAEQRMQSGAQHGNPERRATVEDIARWTSESGMGKGRRADALGDEADSTERHAERDIENVKADESSLGQSVY